jgi:hypothetical protein
MNGLARMLLCCSMICQGVNLVVNPQYYVKRYNNMIEITNMTMSNTTGI